MATTSLFLKWVVAGMVCTGIALFILPAEALPSFYMPTFMGIGALLFAGLIALPPIIFRTPDAKKQKAVKNLQNAVAATLIMSGAGELGLWQLYQIGFEYDKFVHIITPGILTVAGTMFMRDWWGVPHRKALLGTAVAVFLLSLSWEGVEFYSDKIFGTQLFGVYGKQVSQDTFIDIICDSIGVGAAYFLLRSRKV